MVDEEMVIVKEIHVSLQVASLRSAQALDHHCHLDKHHLLGHLLLRNIDVEAIFDPV
jgi:hypothetical protein